MSKGRKNGYICKTCDRRIITIDVDNGTTPFMFKCCATKDCEGFMISMFYSIPQSLPAQYEWFRPDSLDGYSSEMIEHINKGGLDLRKIGGTGELE